MSDLSNILNIGQDVAIILLFISFFLLVFMIYAGICIIKIKNDLNELTDLEFKKYNEKKSNVSAAAEAKEETSDN